MWTQTSTQERTTETAGQTPRQEGGIRRGRFPHSLGKNRTCPPRPQTSIFQTWKRTNFHCVRSAVWSVVPRPGTWRLR